jgi:hypothetical protein
MMLFIFETGLVHFLSSNNVPCALFCAALFALCAPRRPRFIGGEIHRPGFLTLHFTGNLC